MRQKHFSSRLFNPLYYQTNILLYILID